MKKLINIRLLITCVLLHNVCFGFTVHERVKRQTCAEPCLNGGTCTGTDVCSCPQYFAGNRCQFSCNTGDLVILLDASDDVLSVVYDAQKDFAKLLTAEFDVSSFNTRLGVMTYANDYVNEAALATTSDQATFDTTIDGLTFDPTRGTRDVGPALDYAKTVMFSPLSGSRESTDHTLVVLLAGPDGGSPSDLTRYANDLNSVIDYVEVHVVGIGGTFVASEGGLIASSSANVHAVTDFTQLPNLVATLAPTICESKDQCGAVVCQNGGTCTDLNKEYSCACPINVAGDMCEIACGRADIGFIIDHDNSIGTVWSTVKQFYTDISNRFTVSPTDTQIGIVTFDDAGQVETTFDTCGDNSCVVTEINAISSPQGTTNTSGGLWVTNTELFDVAVGDRQDVTNLCVFFTDDRSKRDSALTIPYAAQLQQTCTVLVVAVGDTASIDQAEIDAIASAPLADNQFWIQDGDFSKMTNYVEAVVERGCFESRKSVICDSDPCQNNGTCTIGDLQLGIYECNCTDTGFEGTHCELEIDECLSSPCDNGGTCLDGINEFICNCSDPWFGITCNNDIDECVSDPCEYGGTCIDLFVGFNCTCPDGFLGELCEIPPDFCASTPCLHGGTCTNLIGDYNCTCQPQFLGDNCEIIDCPSLDIALVIDGSFSVSSAQWDSMLDFLASLVAQFDIGPTTNNVCAVVYSSTAVTEFNLTEHLDLPTLQSAIFNLKQPKQSGLANLGISKMKDECMTGARGGTVGKLAFVIQDEEDKDTTQYNLEVTGAIASGVSIFGIGFGQKILGAGEAQLLYAADNDPHFVLVTPSVDDLMNTAADIPQIVCGPNPCQSNPCQNNATCMYNATDLGGYDGYYCNCTEIIYSGVHCEIVTYCDSDPCQNGATCTDSLTDYVCACAAGFEGVICQYVECTDYDICFVVDTSSSVYYDKWLYILEFISGIVSNLKIGVNDALVGVVVYSTYAETVVFLNNTDQAAILDEIAVLPFIGGGTNTANAILIMMQNCFALARGGSVKKRGVVITDGFANDFAALQVEIDKATAEDIDMWAIGYGLKSTVPAFQNELNYISNSNPSKTFVYPSAQVMAQNGMDGALKLCGAVDFCLSNPCLNSGVCYNHPSGYGYLCGCSVGYTGDNCKEIICIPFDVCIIADQSYSMNLHWPAQWTLIENIINTMWNGYNDVSFGVVEATTSPVVSFPVGAYVDKADLITKVKDRIMNPGKTNVAGAVLAMTSSCFTGARPGVNKAAFIISDGTDKFSTYLRQVLREARLAGIDEMVGIAVGPWASKQQLLDIADGSDKRRVILPNFDDMENPEWAYKAVEALCRNN